MRRLVSILLVALFWAGPVAALLPANLDAHLPACCRRQGAHHCAMHMADGAQPVSGHAFAAPGHCPLYRWSGPATLTFTPAAQGELAKLPQAPTDLASTQGAILHRTRTQASRGPPVAR